VALIIRIMKDCKYISMEHFDCNWFFYMEDIRIPDEDFSKIKPLSEEYSSNLWEEFISKKNRHLRLLDREEWPSSLKRINYNFIDDWNSNNYEGLAYNLGEEVSFEENELILFFWMKECAIETTWGMFLKYWVNFLFDDEGPILISTEKEEAVSFSTTGLVFVGKRRPLE
jgi:hypothetical protein